MFLERPHLRFDGLYVSRNTYIKRGLVEWCAAQALPASAALLSACSLCTLPQAAGGTNLVPLLVPLFSAPGTGLDLAVWCHLNLNHET